MADPRQAPDGAPEVAQAGTRSESGSLTLVAFAVLVVLVAANVVAVRFAVRELPPFWGAGARFGAAALLFFGYVLARRLSLPRGRALVGSLSFGVLQFGLGLALGYWALQEVPAGLASVILASVPLFTLAFTTVTRLEPLRAKGVLGGLLALGGIAVLFGGRAGGDAPLPHLLASVGTAAIIAVVPVVIKLFPEVHVATNNAVGMLAGTIVLLALSRITGEAAVIPRIPATWLAQLYLVLPGSVGVFGLLLYLVKRWPASAVSYQTVLSPIMSILLAAWLLDEPVTGGLFLGGALVLVGVYIGAIAPRRGAR